MNQRQKHHEHTWRKSVFVPPCCERRLFSSRKTERELRLLFSSRKAAEKQNVVPTGASVVTLMKLIKVAEQLVHLRGAGFISLLQTRSDPQRMAEYEICWFIYCRCQTDSRKRSASVQTTWVKEWNQLLSVQQFLMRPSHRTRRFRSWVAAVWSGVWIVKSSVVCVASQQLFHGNNDEVYVVSTLCRPLQMNSNSLLCRRSWICSGKMRETSSFTDTLTDAIIIYTLSLIINKLFSGSCFIIKQISCTLILISVY